MCRSQCSSLQAFAPTSCRDAATQVMRTGCHIPLAVWKGQSVCKTRDVPKHAKHGPRTWKRLPRMPSWTLLPSCQSSSRPMWDPAGATAHFSMFKGNRTAKVPTYALKLILLSSPVPHAREVSVLRWPEATHCHRPSSAEEAFGLVLGPWAAHIHVKWPMCDVLL